MFWGLWACLTWAVDYVWQTKALQVALQTAVASLKQYSSQTEKLPYVSVKHSYSTGQPTNRPASVTDTFGELTHSFSSTECLE